MSDRIYIPGELGGNGSEPVEPAMTFEARTLGPEELNAALDAMMALLPRFLYFRTPAPFAIISLWVAHTYVMAAFDYTPYLNVHSPEKRCGKSRLLDLLSVVVLNPMTSVQASPPAIFRTIHELHPTLLLDEVDTIFAGKGADESTQAMRGVLNGGFTRGAKVLRCIGAKHSIAEFDLFCPKVLAGIKSLPSTIADRSIPIALNRRPKDHQLSRFRRREVEPEAAPIREYLERWAADPPTINILRDARPNIPDALGDRQSDICEPLLAIADLAGGDWPLRARNALIEIFGSADAQDDSVPLQLLGAIREIFHKRGADKLATADLLDALMDYDDAPWVSWWAQEIERGNTRGPAAKLAAMLKKHGISSGTIRLDDGRTPKGYKRDAFELAWSCYLPAYSPPGCEGNATTPQQSDEQIGPTAGGTLLL